MCLSFSITHAHHACGMLNAGVVIMFVCMFVCVMGREVLAAALVGGGGVVPVVLAVPGAW